MITIKKIIRIFTSLFVMIMMSEDYDDFEDNLNLIVILNVIFKIIIIIKRSNKIGVEGMKSFSEALK